MNVRAARLSTTRLRWGNMKLAKVEHYRCEQPAGKWGLSSYVWVPDDMSEHEFGLLCEAAKDKYLANEQAWKAAQPAAQPPYYLTVEQLDDSVTVAEVKAAHKTQAEAYKEYEAKRRDARKKFTELLIEVSHGAIKYFWNEPSAVKHELDWGHNHSTVVDYGETKLNDYPPTIEEEEDYV